MQAAVLVLNEDIAPVLYGRASACRILTGKLLSGFPVYVLIGCVYRLILDSVAYYIACPVSLLKVCSVIADILSAEISAGERRRSSYMLRSVLFYFRESLVNL